MSDEPMSSNDSSSPARPLRTSVSDEAKLHADVVSIHQDLAYAKWATERLIDSIDNPENERPDSNELNTYWSGALVAYARCFASGKRLGLKSEIFKDLPGDPLGAHEYFIDQRNKLIAHSVNPFEQVQVGFATDDDDKIIGVGELSMKLVAPDKNGCETLHGLTTFALQFVAKEAEKTRAALLAQGQTLSEAEVRALPTIMITVPHPDKSGKTR